MFQQTPISQFLLEAGAAAALLYPDLFCVTQVVFPDQLFS